MTVTQADVFTPPIFNGQIDAGVTVKYGQTGNQYQIFNGTVGPNFQMNGGTFELDGGASVVIPDTASSLAGSGTLIGNAGLGIDGRRPCRSLPARRATASAATARGAPA